MPKVDLRPIYRELELKMQNLNYEVTHDLHFDAVRTATEIVEILKDNDLDGQETPEFIDVELVERYAAYNDEQDINNILTLISGFTLFKRDKEIEDRLKGLLDANENKDLLNTTIASAIIELVNDISTLSFARGRRSAFRELEGYAIDKFNTEDVKIND